MDFKKKLVKEIFKSEFDSQAISVYKISFIGMDDVGTTIVANFMREYSKPIHLCLIDPDKDKARAVMSDFESCLCYFPSITLSCGSDLALTKDSNILIICFESLPIPKEGIDDIDPVEYNTNLLKSTIPELTKFSPNAIIIHTMFPYNVTSHIILILSNFSKHHIISLGTCIETILFQYAVAKKFNVKPSSVKGWMIGVACGLYKITVWSSVSIAGANLGKYFPQLTEYDAQKRYELLNEIYEIGKKCNILITELPRVVIAAVTYSICESIINDTKKVFPISVQATGVYGIDNIVYLGLPCVIGANGVHAIVEQNLTRFELDCIRKEALRIKKLFAIHNNKLILVYDSNINNELNFAKQIIKNRENQTS